MKKFILLLLVLACTPSMARLRNRVQLQSCQTHFISDEDLLQKNNERIYDRSVFLTGQSLPGFHGGRLLIVFKDADINSWYSHYQIFPSAGQGDPRQLITLLGSSLAHFFGIRQISEREITVPDIAELNGAIKALNKVLVELGYKPIPISFFLQNTEDHNAKTYVQNFTNNQQLPFANHQILLLHDIALHLHSIAFPETILEPIIRRYKLALLFYDYAKTQSSFFPNFEKRFFHYLDRRLDRGTGSIAVAYLLKAQKWRENEKAAIEAAKSVLKDSVEEWMHGDVDISTSMHRMINGIFRGSTFNLKAKIDKFYYNHLLNKFLRQPEISIQLTETRFFKPEQSYDLIEKRIVELKAAYELLKSRGEVPGLN